MASAPSGTVLPAAIVTTGVSGTSLAGIVMVCAPSERFVVASVALSVTVSGADSISESSTTLILALDRAGSSQEGDGVRLRKQPGVSAHDSEVAGGSGAADVEVDGLVTLKG